MVKQNFFKILFISGFLFLIPKILLAHAGHRGFVMLLPTDLFMLGGGLVVVLTFLLMLIVNPKTDIQKFSTPKLSVVRKSRGFLLSSFSLIILIVLVWIGFNGNRDPLKNPLPMTFWIFFWIGMTVFSALFGNLWKVFSPWEAMLKILLSMKFIVIKKFSTEFYKPFSYWPAVVLFSFFAWFELIHPSPMDPGTLANFVLIYIFITIFGIMFLGGNDWLHKGDPFSVYFRMVSWLSPFFIKKNIEKDKFLNRCISVRWPCKGLLRVETLPVSGIAFVLLVLSTVSFDGLSRTFWWLSIWDVNPLEYPGRTSMILNNTIGLYLTFLVFSAAYYITQLMTSILNPKIRRNSSFVYSMIPIAFGYHFAHYLPTFIIDVQYAIISLSDPFDIGWDLFGTSKWIVTSSYLTNYDSVVFIWFFQVLSIVLAHVGAVVVSHLLQLESTMSKKSSFLGQIPSTFLMVGYTVFGLWLLSTPVYS